jgi:hypothetical protein
MKKVQNFCFLFMLAALTLFCGCATVNELPPEKRAGEPAAPEYKMARKVLVHFMNNDAKSFTESLTPENRKEFDVKKFNETREQMLHSLGTPVSFTFLTELEFVTFKLYVWKVRFRRLGKDRETREEKEYFSEALFRVITGRSAGNRLLVMGFNFL